MCGICKLYCYSTSTYRLICTPTIDLSNYGIEEFQQPEFEGYRPKANKSVCKDTSNEVNKTPDAPLGEKLVSEKEKQTVFPTKIESAHCNYHQREGMVNGNNYTRVNYNYSAKKAHPNSHRNMTPRAVLMKTGLKPLNTARPVNTAHPKTTVYRARPMSCFSKLAQSTVKRPYQSRTTLTNKNFNQKINTAKEKVNTAKIKAVNTARPTSVVVNAVRANQTSRYLMEDMLPLGEATSVNMQLRMIGRTCNIKQKCVMNQIPRQLKRGQDTKIPQSSGPPKKVDDEAVHKELGDRMERAATTASSLEAEQDSGNINRTQSMATLNKPSP
ncbi:hypothetical protein Tco_0706335 [Tanacetum coccineum]|uniref:Uncharacterized protein n=1 Tax=Tanacetum coccineum TaxID=301880 RepID=A0ABQ4Y734_9ASTR